jgi:hypothetical protein
MIEAAGIERAGGDGGPRDEAGELGHRLRRWADDWRPASAPEAELVARAARLSWEIERGERAEAAHLARRVELARQADDEQPGWHRLKNMLNIARMLISSTASRDGSIHEGPHWADDPAVLLRAVEETAEGCRWLLEQWAGILGLIERGTPWTDADRYRALRLLGKKILDAVYEPELNATLLAWDVLQAGVAESFWKKCLNDLSELDAGLYYRAQWRRLVKGPSSREEALAWLSRVARKQVDRVEALLAEHDRRARAASAHRDDLAALDAEPALERLRRAQAARVRELHKTIELLLKLRKAAGAGGASQEQATASRVPVAPAGVPVPPSETRPPADVPPAAGPSLRDLPESSEAGLVRATAAPSPSGDPAAGHQPGGRVASRAVANMKQARGPRRDLSMGRRLEPAGGSSRRAAVNEGSHASRDPALARHFVPCSPPRAGEGRHSNLRPRVRGRRWPQAG